MIGRDDDERVVGRIPRRCWSGSRSRARPGPRDRTRSRPRSCARRPPRARACRSTRPRSSGRTRAATCADRLRSASRAMSSSIGVSRYRAFACEPARRCTARRRPCRRPPAGATSGTDPRILRRRFRRGDDAERRRRAVPTRAYPACSNSVVSVRSSGRSPPSPLGMKCLAPPPSSTVTPLTARSSKNRAAMPGPAKRSDVWTALAAGVESVTSAVVTMPTLKPGPRVRRSSSPMYSIRGLSNASAVLSGKTPS